MSTAELTFLGTGTSQGVPIIGCPCPVCHSEDARDKRFRASALVRYGGKVILIDAGPDFRMQMLREGIGHLDGILLTHKHKDHIGGLDDVRALNYWAEPRSWTPSGTITRTPLRPTNTPAPRNGTST